MNEQQYNLVKWIPKKVITIFSVVFQSDVVHQSVFELVHSEDRDELQRQLNWNSFLGPENSTIPIQVRLEITHVFLRGQEVLPEESSSMANVTYFVPPL